MGNYIMALDAGTTSSRCLLFNRKGELCRMAQREIRQYYPRPGWVEQDALEIWEAQVGAAKEAMAGLGIGPEEIAAIGIANQRETTVVWDRNTGMPVCRAIAWQCRRTARYCDTLKEKGMEGTVKQKTGLKIDAYFSGSKLKWILDHVEGARERGKRGELLFGTVDTWLMWKLSGGRIHATDYSNASRTMLFDIHTLRWDEELLDEMGIPAQMLPQVQPSSWLYGYTEPTLFGGKIPIAGAIGDQQAALFGQACFEKGMCKNTYGTGGFLLMNTGENPVFSSEGLVTTIAWGMEGKITYALEGSIFVAGAAVQWLRDELKLIGSAAETEELAACVSDTAGCYFVPAFVGLGAPYWDPYARGAFVGLSRGVNRNHLVRAVLDALCYQVRDVAEVMERESGTRLTMLKVDGGASANNYLLQCQADLCGIPVRRPDCVETTALGAAWLAGLAVKYWENLEEIQENCRGERVFFPQITEEVRA
ncbi:MAG: glycerol kinase GlpK [Eubacteriales bacterium]|nr:glycerol kinase GlpK [Eubacteriales bacterium]